MRQPDVVLKLTRFLSIIRKLILMWVIYIITIIIKYAMQYQNFEMVIITFLLSNEPILVQMMLFNWIFV